MSLLQSIFLMGGAPGAEGGGGTSTLIMFAMIFGVMYFFMIRPQAKKAKEQKKFVEAIQKGDRIVTTSGIHGKILDLGDTTIMLEVDSGHRIKFDRAAISLDATKLAYPKTTTEVKA